jgi:hypothetical protein
VLVRTYATSVGEMNDKPKRDLELDVRALHPYPDKAPARRTQQSAAATGDRRDFKQGSSKAGLKDGTLVEQIKEGEEG